MNDISVKIVETPKELVGVEVASTGDYSDPLALDDEVKSKDVLTSVGDSTVEKEGTCDENAKEEVANEVVKEESDSLKATQVEQGEGNSKEEESKDQQSNLESKLKDPVQSSQDEPKSESTQATELSEEQITSEIETVVETELEKVKLEKEETITIKEASPERDIEKEKVVSKVADVEMTEVATVEEKAGPKEIKSAAPVNGNIALAKEEVPIKRRASEETETESPLKRLCMEVEKTFPQHDIMINDYIQTTTKNNVDEIQRHTEQLLSEIHTLRELAQKKEQEWNNILHLKKVKEEILLRLLRRKQVLSFEKAAEMNGTERTDPFDYLNPVKSYAIDKSDEISGLVMKQPNPMNPMMQTPVMPVTTHFNPMSGLPPPYDKAAHMQGMPKPVFPQPLMMPGPMQGFPRDMNGQLTNSFGMPMGRQGPTKDVKSIIADYRQRNPEVAPPRRRRMKSMLNPNMMNAPRPIAPKMDGMNNLANLNMLFNNLDMNQKAMLERLQQIQQGGLPNGLSFKDVLVQFANMQQANPSLIPTRPMETATRPDHHIRPEGRRRPERNHEEAHSSTKQPERLASSSPRLPPPPPYPEISLLPVTTSQETTQTQQNSLLHGILTKNCGEITITPVQPTPPPDAQPDKPEEIVQLDDEESPASETSAGSPGAGARLALDATDDAPLCQGCRARDAQFVCAGCANQWYCSRDCQVAAWDDHSEMCSG